ncbi:MAG: hypothetical protein JW861_09750 [Bacteroidales bacterium]|nr:hypothetical protein [Bacteroidales bacterium]
MPCRFYIFLLFSGLFAREMHASHIEVSGLVSGTWDADTVLVTGDIYIPDGEALSVPPGTIVIFMDHYLFTVAGRITAVGTPEDTIRFMVADTAGFSVITSKQGGWGGFRFDHLSPANDSSLFVLCRFEHAKAAGQDTIFWYGGAFFIRDFNRLRIDRCHFVRNRAVKNGGALWTSASDILVTRSLFQNNDCGLDTLYGYGGAASLYYSDARILHCRFLGNTSTGVGGGLSFEYSDPLVNGNLFADNFSALGGGLCALRSDGIRPVVNNLFHGNSAYFFGGAVALITASIALTCNTIADNTGGAGGGLFVNFESFPVLTDNILWGNTDLGGGGPQVYIWDTFSAPGFYWCDIEGGVDLFGGTGGQPGGFIGVYQDCIEENPLFLSSGDDFYALLSDSPCINAGSPDTTGLFLPPEDYSMNPRLVGGRVDMGAYEYPDLTGDHSAMQQECSFRVYPTVFAESFTIDAEVEQSCHITVILSGTDGRVWHRSKYDITGPGRIPVRIEPSPTIHTGPVICRVFCGTKMTQKVLIRTGY